MEKKIKVLRVAVVALSIITILEFLVIIFSILKLFDFKETIKGPIDASNYSNSELVDMFEKEGYSIRFVDIDECLYILLENEENGITIQRIPKTFVGPLMTFSNESINDEMADLLVSLNNNTMEKQLQYKNYEEWLKNYNLTTPQVVKMLENYYSENKTDKDKTKVINTQELLNSSKY